MGGLSSSIQSKFSGQGLKQISFYSPDGYPISFNSKLFSVMSSMPYINMRVKFNSNLNQEYNIITPSMHGHGSVSLTPVEKVHYDHNVQEGLSPSDSMEVAKFQAILDQKMDTLGDGALTQNDLALIVRESLHEHAEGVRSERKLLRNQLEILKRQLEPQERIVAECEHHGKVVARRYINTFAGFIGFQYFLTQYGTYVAFSWDIIEPFSCLMSFSDAFFAYVFWVYTGKPWDLVGLQEHFSKKKMEKAMKKNHFNLDKYESKKRAIAAIEARLKDLS